jgi:hypothetical protein
VTDLSIELVANQSEHTVGGDAHSKGGFKFRLGSNVICCARGVTVFSFLSFEDSVIVRASQ